MHEQHMEPIKEREKNSAHLKITSYQEKEDIQDFLKIFEGIVGIQKVKGPNWCYVLPQYSMAKQGLFAQILDPLQALMEKKKLFWNIKTLVQKMLMTISSTYP